MLYEKPGSCGTFENESHKVGLSMTRFRKRIGTTGAEELLKETIKAGLKLKAVKKTQLKRVNVDTSVQEKDVRFPTDARLYDRARERLEIKRDQSSVKT